MPYVQVPKDLTKVKTKVAMNLTKRQIICFALAGVVGAPIYFLTRSFVGNDIAMIFLVIIALPFFLLAMYERDGQPLEKILKTYIQWRNAPKVRVYQTQNLYAVMSKNDIAEGGIHIAKKPKTFPKNGKRRREKCSAKKSAKDKRKTA